MSSLLLCNRVHRLEIQSVMFVFSTPLVYCCHSTFSLTSPPPLPKVMYTVYTDNLWLWGWGWGVLSCVVDHILEELNTLFLTSCTTPNKNDQ
jgi:hypothetical protein